jgi:hypothetical protein
MNIELTPLEHLALNAKRIQTLRFTIARTHPVLRTFRTFLVDNLVELIRREEEILFQLGSLEPVDFTHFHIPTIPHYQEVIATFTHFSYLFQLLPTNQEEK